MKNNQNNFFDLLSTYSGIKSDQLIAELEKELTEVVEKTQGPIRAQITSAVALNDAEKSLLDQIIDEIVSKPLTKKFSVNPNVIGGFKIKIGDWELNSTLDYQMQRLKKDLIDYAFE